MNEGAGEERSPGVGRASTGPRLTSLTGWRRSSRSVAVASCSGWTPIPAALWPGSVPEGRPRPAEPLAHPDGRRGHRALPGRDRGGRARMRRGEAPDGLLRAPGRARLGGARAHGRDRPRPRPARDRRRQARRRAGHGRGLRPGAGGGDPGALRSGAGPGRRRLHRQPTARPGCPGAADRRGAGGRARASSSSSAPPTPGRPSSRTPAAPRCTSVSPAWSTSWEATGRASPASRSWAR